MSEQGLTRERVQAKLDHTNALLKEMKANIAKGQTTTFMKLPKKATGARIRILPGVMGRVIQWGDGSMASPTVAEVRCWEMEMALQLVKKDLEELLEGFNGNV